MQEAREGQRERQRRLGWSVRVHLVESEEGGGGDARAEDGRRTEHEHERVRQGTSVWIPLLCEEMLGTVDRVEAEANALTLRSTRGTTMILRRYQRVEVLCWWDLTRGVRGRRFHWCSPSLVEFLGLGASDDPVTERRVS